MCNSASDLLKLKKEKEALQALKNLNKELDGKLNDNLNFGMFAGLSVFCITGAITSIAFGVYTDSASFVTAGGLFNIGALASIYKMSEYVDARTSNLILYLNNTQDESKKELIENYKKEYKDIKNARKQHSIGTIEAINKKRQLMNKYAEELSN